MPIHEIIDAVQFIQGRSGLSMSDLFPAITYRKLCKIISQIKKGNKMKKFLVVLTLAMLPSSAFAIIGFGIQAGQDMAKLDAYSYTEGEGLTAVTINSFEMETNPLGGGAYAFVDLFDFLSIFVDFLSTLWTHTGYLIALLIVFSYASSSTLCNCHKQEEFLLTYKNVII